MDKLDVKHKKRTTSTASSSVSFNSAIASAAFQNHRCRSLLTDTSPHLPNATTVKDKQKLRKKLSEVRSKIDTGLKSKPCGFGVDLQADQREYVLQYTIPDVSLAQRLGFLPGPACAALTESQWCKLKRESKERQIFDEPCAICKEEFGVKKQLLLSCSHVFHFNCLKNLEKYTGKRKCPLCRKAEYEARVIHDGRSYYINKSAVRIQACWRGYITRKWYKKLRKNVPPKDSSMQKKWLLSRVEEITERLVNMCNNNECIVNRVLTDCENTLQNSRASFTSLDSYLACRQRGSDFWTDVISKGIERGDEDCPICIGDMRMCQANRQTGSIAILACSHAFHRTCLETVEIMCDSDGRFCPLCRSSYWYKHIF